MGIRFYRMRGLGKQIGKAQSRHYIHLAWLLKALQVQFQNGVVVEHIVVQDIEEIVVINASEYGVTKFCLLRIVHRTTSPFMT